LVLGLGGCGAIVYTVYRTSIAPARQAVDDYYGALARGDDRAAFEEVCPGAGITFAVFTRLVDAKPMLRWRTSTVNVSTVNGSTSGTVGGVVTYRDGTTRAGVVDLVKQRGGWRLCGGLLSPNAP